jgi:MerR family transcriptional regulator, thiopeptide resistance regulator
VAPIIEATEARRKAMASGSWKVGELARRTGVTVRTLHHYDEIGLLRPSLHTDSGHRLYTPSDVDRLQRIVSLRQLGLALEEVRDCLDRPGFSPSEVIGLHVARLRERIARERRLCRRLEDLAARLREAEAVSADEFIAMIREMTMIENYYTPEQLEALKARGAQLGEEGMRRAQEEWAELIARVREAMERGTDPSSPEILDLARRWKAKIRAFSGGDPGIERAAGRVWAEQGDAIAAQHGSQYDPRGVMEYIGRAISALKDED